MHTASLLLQALPSLLERFQIEFVVRIVDDRAKEGYSTGGDVEVDAWGFDDATRLKKLYRSIHLGDAPVRDADAASLATRIALHATQAHTQGKLGTKELLEKLITVGTRLWSHARLRSADARIAPLDSLAASPAVSEQEAAPLLDANVRAMVKHTAGGVLCFAGADVGSSTEYYWGVDRCGFLERRLIEMRLVKSGQEAMVLFDKQEQLKLVKMPAPAKQDLWPNGIELFYSFRSP
jgi:hypothetical protein